MNMIGLTGLYVCLELLSVWKGSEFSVICTVTPLLKYKVIGHLFQENISM